MLVRYRVFGTVSPYVVYENGQGMCYRSLLSLSGGKYGHFEIDMYNDKCNVTILNVR